VTEEGLKMNFYDHLPLPLFQGEIQRQTRGRGGGFKLPEGRNKRIFSRSTAQGADSITSSFKALKNRFSGSIDPSLIYEIEINQSVSPRHSTDALLDGHTYLSAETKRMLIV
jgi:hypothetical protein